MAKDRERTPQQRAALLAIRLVRGDGITTSQVAEWLGMSYQGARRLLMNLSGPELPVVRDEDGRWRYIY